MKTPKAKQLPSGQWYCRVRVDGKDVSITRDTEKAAIAEAMAVKAGIKRENKAENITLRKAIDRFLEDRGNILSPSTVRGYRIIQENRFPDLIDKPISKYTFSIVQAAVNQEARRYAPKTVRNSYGLLRKVLAEFNPGLDLENIKIPPRQKTVKRIYNSEELRRYLDQVRGSNVELPVMLAVWLGLRRSEIIGLRWQDVDFKNGVIRIVQALVQDENNEYKAKGTKTVESTRVLSCPPYILDLIAKQEKTGDQIITTSPQTMRNRMVKVAEAAGLPFIGLHALRHQNATVMMDLGIPEKYAMERGGWSSNHVMREVYQHTLDDGRRQATEKIDQYFENMTESKGPKRYKLVKHIKKQGQ